MYIHSYTPNTRTVVLILFLVLLFTFPKNSLLGQQIKNLEIGSLHSWFRSDGSELRYGVTTPGGLAWPALYAQQDCDCGKGFWIGTTDYTDAEQYGGQTFPYKVVAVGPRTYDVQNEFIPIEFKTVGKFTAPVVMVDGLLASDLTFADDLDEVDASIPSDRMIYNVVNTSIGLTMTRKVMAWAQEGHDNYFIYEYIFKNTGNVDADPEIEKPNQTLTGVYPYYFYRYCIGRNQGARWVGEGANWGNNTQNTTRGEAKETDGTGSFSYPGDYEDWLNGDPDADSIRAQIAWMGSHSERPYDVIGSPYVEGDGRLGAAQFAGTAVLHVDRSSTDKSDDPTQPATTTIKANNSDVIATHDQFDREGMTVEYSWMEEGHMLPRHDEQTNGPRPEDPIAPGFANSFKGERGGWQNAYGMGPFTLGPNDSIRIVITEGVDGIRRELQEEIGANWLEEYENPTGTKEFILPDGSVTNNHNEYKNTWVFTGFDSLMNTFGRARQNFESDYTVVTAPPPPATFEVNSYPDRVELLWDSNAENSAGFGGYRIYRAEGGYDGQYEEIFACGEGTDHPEVVNSFDDTDATRGFSYYYYITSFSDNGLESSLFWTRTNEPAVLTREPGAGMSDIRIVPNPYNKATGGIQFPGEPDKIMFYNIPPECTIRIYTERGDLIKTIEHTDGSGDEPWFSNTESRQVVVSGIYFVTFETPDGKTAIRKLAIIR